MLGAEESYWNIFYFNDFFLNLVYNASGPSISILDSELFGGVGVESVQS